MGDDGPLFSIGELANRAGLPVRTIRFWSDTGLLPPAGRTASGRRRYDPACLVRLELIATLRELGLGLADVRRVLDGQATLAAVATVQVTALDAQIRTLRLRRAVLAAALKRGASSTEMTTINKLARLSAAERRQIIDEFTADVFRGLNPGPAGAARWAAAPMLPDDPSPAQLEAWVELAGLAGDPDFRDRLRQVSGYGIEIQAGRGLIDIGRAQQAAELAREQGVEPDSAAAAELVDGLLASPAGQRRRPEQQRDELVAQLDAATDPRIERYWELTAVIAGRPPFESPLPALRWLAAALRAAPHQPQSGPDLDPHR